MGVGNRQVPRNKILIGASSDDRSGKTDSEAQPTWKRILIKIGQNDYSDRLLGRVLINRPAVSAFGQSGHWSRHRRMTEDPERT
jgi:hypothetical protein